MLVGLPVLTKNSSTVLALQCEEIVSRLVPSAERHLFLHNPGLTLNQLTVAYSMKSYRSYLV